MNIIVIGGGPSGMMSAIKASEGGHDVTLFERNSNLGKKLLATGNRRCNITNNKPTRQLISAIHNGKFLYSMFDQFDVQSIIDFFYTYGLHFREEEDNKMYPITNRSSDVLDVLKKALKDNHVNVKHNSLVESIIIDNERVKSVTANNKTYACDHLIIATGGVSFPFFGSDGLMHGHLKSHNITSTPLYACEAPLLSNDKRITSLKLVGLSLSNIHLTIVNDKSKAVYATDGDLMITHHGLSGPAALKSSEYVHKLLSKGSSAIARLSFINSMNQSQFEHYLKTNKNETLRRLLNQHLPKRLTDHIIETLKIDPNSTITQISKQNLERLYSLVFRYDIRLNAVESIQKAFVTGGGIDLKQIDSKTMKHQDIKNLSLCGELLDLHGPLGGYNLTIAFLTGMLAGTSI